MSETLENFDQLSRCFSDRRNLIVFSMQVMEEDIQVVMAALADSVVVGSAVQVSVEAHQMVTQIKSK